MGSSSYAPIILFAFNRIDLLKRCVSSLLENKDVAETDLFVFVDGPRADKEGESEKVEIVREYVKGIGGFKSKETHFSDTNKGLGPSIINGVTEIINRYGCAIVIEDDLVVSSNFLAYMNAGLKKYEGIREVFSICGYSNKVRVPKGYVYDSYFCSRSSSWGWATWKDRWNSCDWKLDDWGSVCRNKKAFNHWGGSDCFGMLQGWKYGRNQSWAIRFCYNQFIQNAVSLFPIISKVDNEGFDGNGTNCTKYNRFKFVFDNSDNKSFNMPESVAVNSLLWKSAMKYHSILIRLYSKVMNMLYKLKVI
mgnify:CR=1 FL=1